MAAVTPAPQHSTLVHQSPINMELVPNPTFRFPMRPEAGNASSSSTVRPASVHSSLGPSPRRPRTQRQSLSALPTFSFNATDSSGLHNASSEAPSSMALPVTPKNMRHQRGRSEFVGGDSRLGVSNLITTSPTKASDAAALLSNPPTNASPVRKRGHAHRRSAAISGHDLSSIMQPRDVNVPSAAASTSSAVASQSSKDDMDLPVLSPAEPEISIGEVSPTHQSFGRPPSRPRVGFSENVEYIPRPLSTVSSDTASSISTVRGHSIANSFSSVINVSAASPSPLRQQSPPMIDLDSAAPPPAFISPVNSRTSLDDASRHLRTPGTSPNPASTSTSPNLSITLDIPDSPPFGQRRKHFLRLDRRKSEPLISPTTFDQPRVSTISLQERPVTSNAHDGTGTRLGVSHDLERKSSRKRVRNWASAILSRKSRDPRKTKSLVMPKDTTPSQPQIEVSSDQTRQSLDEEPDLDALFNQDPFTDTSLATFSLPRAQMALEADSSYLAPRSPGSRDVEDTATVIDLDAALGPYGTPSMSWDNQSSNGRRSLHSSRGSRNFAGTPRHSRTLSAPALGPFKYDRSSSPSKSPMDDVFEEEEETESEVRASATLSVPSLKVAANEARDEEEEAGTGIHVVESAVDSPTEHSNLRPQWNVQDGLGIDRCNGVDVVDMAFQHLSVPLGTRRTSVVEDTIMEESSPIEIVEAHEEPRTSSLTKSSDSSDTIHEDRTDLLFIPPANLSPASFNGSVFSSPDMNQHQNVFDPARVGTSGSSAGDSRTVSSAATGEVAPDVRTSSDDVPSLTSSRSTMLSTMHHNGSRRDFSDRSGSVASTQESHASERRRKRSSIHSLSKLVGASFGDARLRTTSEQQRPQTALAVPSEPLSQRRKENRLTKLMFWRPKSEKRSASLSQ